MLHYFQLLIILLFILWLTWHKPLLFLSWTSEIVLQLFSLLYPPIHTPHCEQNDLFKMQSDHGTLLSKIPPWLSIVYHSMESKVLQCITDFASCGSDPPSLNQIFILTKVITVSIIYNAQCIDGIHDLM